MADGGRFLLAQFGTKLLTRDQGASVREEIERRIRSLQPEEALTVDFEGVTAITPSFVDELLGRLLLLLGRERFRVAVRLCATDEAETVGEPCPGAPVSRRDFSQEAVVGQGVSPRPAAGVASACGTRQSRYGMEYFLLLLVVHALELGLALRLFCPRLAACQELVLM